MTALATAVVVDRWPLVRMGLGGVLAAVGVSVVGEATKASEGMRLTRAQLPDVLVFGTPGDGLEPAAIRAVKREPPAPRVVVLVEDGASAADISLYFQAGADALLGASVERDELADALHRIALGERVIGRSIAAPGAQAGSKAPPPGPAILTGKELEVLVLLAQGHSNKQIARALFVSEPTVKTHLAHVYAKLGVQSRHAALMKASGLGLL